MSSSFVDVKRDEMFQRLICLFWWKHGGLVASVEKHVPMLYTLEQPPSDADCTEGSGDGRPPTTDHHLCPQTSSSAPWIRIRTIQIRPQTKSGDTTSSISFRGETIIVLLFLNRFMRSRVSLNSFWKSTDDDQTLKLGDSRRFDPQVLFLHRTQLWVISWTDFLSLQLKLSLTWLDQAVWWVLLSCSVVDRL